MQFRLGIYLFLVLFIKAQTAQAQFDIKLGYEGQYQNFDQTNELIKGYNDENKWLDKEFKMLHGLHGVSLGLRYKPSQRIGLEASYSNKWSERSASGYDSNTATDSYLKIGHRDVHYALGIEFFIIERFSFGGNISYNQFSASSASASEDELVRLFLAEGAASQFFLSYNIPTNSITKICLRPYLQSYWHSPSILALNQELNGPDPSSNIEEPLMGFGISLVFYNGNSSW